MQEKCYFIGLDEGPGDCCFFPANMMHLFTVVSDEPAKILVAYSPPYEESPDRVILSV